MRYYFTIFALLFLCAVLLSSPGCSLDSTLDTPDSSDDDDDDDNNDDDNNYTNDDDDNDDNNHYLDDDDDDDNDYWDDDDDVDDYITDATPGTWYDPTTGLIWKNPPADGEMEWEAVQNYCDRLFVDGYNDWRLPSIDELRSLIRGCPSTIPGGACEVRNGCLDPSCYNDPCTDCSFQGGPMDGCYWPNGVIGRCSDYWSSSPVASSTQSYNYVWSVSFSSGNVIGEYVEDNSGTNLVRCVRGGAITDDDDDNDDNDNDSSGCFSDYQCPENAHCVVETGYCHCNEGYIIENGRCVEIPRWQGAPCEFSFSTAIGTINAGASCPNNQCIGTIDETISCTSDTDCEYIFGSIAACSDMGYCGVAWCTAECDYDVDCMDWGTGACCGPVDTFSMCYVPDFCESTDLCENVTCVPNSYCDIVTGVCVCDDGYHEEHEECVPDINNEGICIEYANSQGGQDLQCRALCTPVPHNCGNDFMCFPYAALGEDNMLTLGGGYCMNIYDPDWLGTLPECDPESLEPCSSLNNTQGVCLSDGTRNYCLPVCAIVSDTCPAGSLPGAEVYGEAAFGCVGYPNGQGGTVGMCEPWGGAPPCNVQGEACEP